MAHIGIQYFLNHRLKESELRRQVRSLAAAGYECIFAHARQGLTTAYFSESWWEAIDVILDECQKQQVKFAIWDEDYFPSPRAGNRIFLNHPELAACKLDFSLVKAEKGEQIEHHYPAGHSVLRCFAVYDNGHCEDVTRHCGTICSEWTTRKVQLSAYSPLLKMPAPHWRASINDRHFTLLWQAPETCRVVSVCTVRAHELDRHNPDLLNRKTTEKFIEYTHEAYYARYHALFPEWVAASFMDEPAPFGIFPWTEAFPEEFQQDHAYDLLPLLPHLYLNIDSGSPVIRSHYRMTQQRLLCENFLQPIQDWCHQHGIVSAGHLTRTEWVSYSNYMWPDELRCCKYLDIPCADPLGALLAWPDAASYHTGLKLVSSAAHIFGKKQAGSDALAVCGNESALRDLRFMLDYHLVMGITWFNIHGASYSFAGPRKDEVPPSLFEQHTEWEFMPELIKNIRIKCEQLSAGSHCCEIAVLFPAAGLYCMEKADMNAGVEIALHSLSENLLSRHKDFDLLDEISLAELFQDDRTAFIGKYPFLIVPETDYISSKTAGLLQEYQSGGGLVLLAGEKPQLLGATAEEGVSVWQADKVGNLQDMLDQLPGPKLEGEGGSDVFVQRRKQGSGQNLVFLFNRSEKAFTGKYEDTTVFLPPRSGELLQPGKKCRHPLENFRPIQTLRDWKVRFEENHLPLNYWSVYSLKGDLLGNLELMSRPAFPELATDQEVCYQSSFLYSGEPGSLQLVFDSETFAVPWECLVNQQKTGSFERLFFYEPDNLALEISPLLRSGNNPTLNTLTLLPAKGKQAELQEVPYLRGNFQAEIRHGHLSQPYLCACDNQMSIDTLRDWRSLGYFSYSGAALYETTLTINQPGVYALDGGELHDSVQVSINSKPLAILINPPYALSLGSLQPGRYQLQLKVRNAPGNRDRLSGRPAGLYGPVTLYRQDIA